MRLPGSRVYFARCRTWGGSDMAAIKIGNAIDPAKRVIAVAALAPFDCELICSIPGDTFTEAFVHMWLRSERIRGEFFKARGETMRVVEHVRAYGCLPLPLYEGRNNRLPFNGMDINGYMERHGITFAEVEDMTGVGSKGRYRKQFESTGTVNRRFLAGLAVTAIKRGLSVTWPLDFEPNPKQMKVAA